MAKVKNFVAHYMPAHDGEDPSMSGFKPKMRLGIG